MNHMMTETNDRGLKIMDLEKEWKHYPVIRLDMSRGGANAGTLRSYLNLRFKEYENLYGITPDPTARLADRFHGILSAANKKTGLQVAILKADDNYERFVFITGITKFTQISLFSVLNNLTNISFDAPYAALCGIIKDEIKENFMPEITMMGEQNGWSTDETIEQLQAYYDGYHFSRKNMVDVFNPFSLIHALSDNELRNYWAASGATSLLPKFVDDLDIRLKDFENCALISSVIETSDVTGGGPELFLYQSGYLTIKGYMSGTYLLGIPNHEVRQALNEIVLPTLAMRKTNDTMSTLPYIIYM